MLIPSKSEPQEIIPLEVKVWLDKGWTVIPSERRGYVLSGQKTMRSLDRIGLTIGIVLLSGFFFGIKLLGFIGLVLIVSTVLDYKYNTKPPTKFFPEPGEKPRTIERE